MAETERDKTFEQECRYGSISWVCAQFGKGDDWFRKNRETLENDGFPMPDKIVKFYLKDDVTLWINERSQFGARMSGITTPTTSPKIGGYNEDAL